MWLCFVEYEPGHWQKQKQKQKQKKEQHSCSCIYNSLYKACRRSVAEYNNYTFSGWLVFCFWLFFEKSVKEKARRAREREKKDENYKKPSE
jgi:hypothetical protein